MMTPAEQLNMVIDNCNYAYDIGDMETVHSHDRFITEIYLNSEYTRKGGRSAFFRVSRDGSEFIVYSQYPNRLGKINTVKTSIPPHWAEVGGFMHRNGYTMKVAVSEDDPHWIKYGSEGSKVVYGD